MKTTPWIRSKWTLAVSLLLALTLVVSACGGDDSDNETAGNGGESSSVDPAAKTAVDEHIKNPTQIGPTKPVGKPIPAGKKISIVSCGQPGCLDVVHYFQKAAEVLGWDVTVVTAAQPTPQAIQQVMQQVVASKPDAVVTTSTLLSNFKREAAELEAQKIPLVTVFGAEPAGGPVTVAVSSSEDEKVLAALAADKVAVDLGGEGMIGVISLSGFPSVPIFLGGFYDEIKKVCSKCETKELIIQPAAIGSTDGRDVANFVRANPDMKAIMLGFDGLAADLKAATAAAGIEQPKTYSMVATAGGIPKLNNGERAATVPQDFAVVGWQIADSLARIFTGQVEDAKTEGAKYHEPVIWSKDYNNVPEIPDGEKILPPTVADYEAQFKELWGK
jgi:ribose transport system substrate-binding protein